jgi:hypothetical protein
MTCETVMMKGGTAAIVCTRGRRKRPPRCSIRGCGAPAEFQCDAPLGGNATCDRYLCAEHRSPQGNDIDFCPEHAREARLRIALATHPDP